MLDYYVVISLSAKLSEGQPFRIFNLERLAMFKALHGQQDRRNWRPVPLEMLDGWLHLFPEVSSKNETILPRQRSGRTNILSGAEDRLSRRPALSLPLFFGLPLHPVTRPTLQKIFSLARQAAAIKPARAVLAQPLTIELFHASTLPCYSPAARPRRGAHAALCWSH